MFVNKLIFTVTFICEIKRYTLILPFDSMWHYQSKMIRPKNLIIIKPSSHKMYDK